MATEAFLVTTLPRTADPSRSVHASLFITHRLTPDGATGVVGDFEHVRRWTEQLAEAEIELRGRVGAGPAFTIPSTPWLAALEPSLWPRVFPPDLEVRPWQTPDPAATPWQSFPAHRLQQHALLTHAAAVFSSPVGSPSVRGNALTLPLMNAIGLGQYTGFDLDDLLNRSKDGDDVFLGLPIDEFANDFLDRMINAGGTSTSVGAAAGNPLVQLTTDAHRVRRYYLRDEEQHAYQAVPDDDPVIPAIAKPEPDFHARASLLGDLSPLLRSLGLVVDLRVDDVAALAGVTEIGARIQVPGIANPVTSQPRTRCVVDGRSFVAASQSGDHHRGLLRLGDEERFRVLDLDPDASGLKLEQYVRTVPRLLLTENNGDHVTSSPPGLRATGLSIARVDRADQIKQQLTGAPARDADLMSGTGAPLTAEEITRGFRLEVWDDVSKEWHSLHRRRLTVEVEGAGEVITDAPDVGFLQGAALTRVSDGSGPVAGSNYHAHEVVAGWDGWSLSVPRPGLVTVHVDGEEQLVEAPDPDPDPVNPVASTTSIEPLTLPWLRYGRNYAFRAWTVDLAGNSAPHLVAGPEPDDGPESLDPPTSGRPPRDPGKAARDRNDRLAARTAETRLRAIPLDATVDAQDSFGAGDAIRNAVRALRPVEEPGPRPGAGVKGLDLRGIAPAGFDEVDRVVRDRIIPKTQLRSRVGPTRRERIERTFDVAAAALPRLGERIDARVPPQVMGGALIAAMSTLVELSDLSGPVLAEIADLITTPRPFLRWDPIVEPVVVPRHPYTEAESQLTLVIRSGVEPPTDDDPLAVTIVDPATYSAATIADHPELDLQWRADSQRHLAPPKSSQLDAELHGLFDDAIGAASPDAVRTALAIALRESGTLLDDTIADIANPGARIPQHGVELHTGPTAEPPTITDPADLVRGAGLAKGQYVVHDTDDLVLPYLPDPMATKVSMTFPDAGVGHHLFGLFAIEGVTLPYGGTWPEREPFRLVLESGAELSARQQGRVVTIQVPPGEQLRMNLSSGLERDQLALHGLWRSLPDAIQNNDVLTEAAADGWFWWLTPPTPVRLVHAVQRPVEVPRPTVLLPIRTKGDTAITLLGGVDLHGPSTERLDIEADWSEWIDDIAKPAPERIDVTAAAASTTVRYDEDLIVLAGADATVPLPDGTTLNVHAAVHQIGDTRHRSIDYRMRATTRYREYFDSRVVPSVDDLSVVGPVRTLDVPSTARPAKPLVRDVLPMFRWYEETEPAQPFGLRRTRGAGLRVYLDRPWFSSGDGELLGLVVAFGSDADVEGNVTVWGGDPVFVQEGPANRSILPLTDLAHLVGLDDRREGARPVGPPVARTLVDVPGNPAVWVLGYEPAFSEDRGLWFADIALDPGTAIWPFVRLALTRYQPDSLAGLHLSPVVQCDFVPLPPERVSTLTRPDNRHARVIVTGPVGAPRTTSATLSVPTFAQSVLQSRTVRARLEHKVSAVPGDLGWETVRTLDLPILGFEGTTVSWSGEIQLPQAVAPRRPGTSQVWRITVEEWEHLPADPDASGRSSTQSRIVYADHLPL